MKLACTKALTPTQTKARQIIETTIMPMTLMRLNQVLPSQPTVWNMLQNPWERWNHRAANQRMYITRTHQCPKVCMSSV